MNLNNEIALFGGTFDPIHKGHIACAKHVAQWLGLTQVCLIPSHIPPHKSSTTVSALDRLAMVKLAIKDDPFFSVDDREVLKKTTSYTVETLEELLEELKADKTDRKFYFIIGMDSLIHFTKWHRWQDILKLCHIVVSTRPGYDVNAIPNELNAFIEKDAERITQHCTGKILIAPPCFHDISSTEIRHFIANQQKTDTLLPQPVSKYIRINHLYAK